LKRVFPFTRPMRGVLGEGGRWGGPQRGGPSWRSWQMSLPPLQMHPSCSPHEEQGQWLGDKAACNPRQWRGNGRDWTEVRASKTLKRSLTDQSHRRRPMRHRTSPRNQPGSRREPRDQHGEQDMRNARARTQGKKRIQGGQKKKYRKNKRKSISMEK